jgi:hypothetical protein
MVHGEAYSELRLLDGGLACLYCDDALVITEL